jgi:hypothetical protein
MSSLDFASHELAGFSGACIEHMPELQLIRDANCFKVWGFVVNEEKYYRQDGKWRAVGRGPFVSHREIVCEMISWEEKHSNTGLSKYEIKILESVVEMLSSALDAIDRQKQIDRAMGVYLSEANATVEYAGFQKSKSVGFVYLMKHKNGLIKIGYSKNPAVRERTLQAEDPNLKLIAKRKGGVSEERRLHSIFSDKRIRGEWFQLTAHELSWLIFLGGFQAE